MMRNTHKKIVLTLGLVLCTLLCASQRVQAQEGTIRLRVMSMNIKEGGRYCGFLSAPFAELINQHKPDVVCLQEVDHRTTRNGGRDWLHEVAAATGMMPYFCQSMTYQGGGFGTALLCRYPFHRLTKIITTLEGAREPRSTGWLYFALPEGGIVRVASTHLALESSQMTIRHLADVNSKLFAEDESTPTLLVGDFNAAEGSDPISYAANRWVDLGRGYGNTYPSSREDITYAPCRLDYVMAYPKTGWSVVSYEILDCPELSDHRFIVAELTYTPNN